MSQTVTNPQNDRRTLTQRGTEVGADNVELLQNAPNRMDPVIQWTGPRKFRRIEYAAGVHPTRFVPRTLETATSDGAATEFALATNVLPIAGKAAVNDQEWPAVVAMNTDTGNQLTIADIEYGSNTVTLDAAPPAPPAGVTDNLKFYPVIGDGTVQYRGIDQFNHEVGSLDNWGTPIQDFSDHDQMKQDSMIHLVGSLTFRENETVGLFVNSPQQIVWQDPDYPEGDYVSLIEQKVDVSV